MNRLVQPQALLPSPRLSPLDPSSRFSLHLPPHCANIEPFAGTYQRLPASTSWCQLVSFSDPTFIHIPLSTHPRIATLSTRFSTRPAFTASEAGNKLSYFCDKDHRLLYLRSRLWPAPYVLGSGLLKGTLTTDCFGTLQLARPTLADRLLRRPKLLFRSLSFYETAISK